MATIDPSIALQVRQVADPLESYGKAVSLKSLANQQRMQEAQFAQFEENNAAERKLNELYRTNIGADGQVNRQGLLSGVAAAGHGSRIPGLQKGFAEADKTAAESKKLGIENKTKGLEYISTYLPKLAANPNLTQQDVIAAVAQVPPDVLDPQMSAQFIRNLPVDPNQLRRTLLMVGQSAGEQLKSITPEFKTIDGGNRVITGTVDPSTGQFSPQGAPIVKAPEGFVVGPDGRLAADPGYVSAKSQIARAGASNVTYGTPMAGVDEQGNPVYFQPSKGGGAPAIVPGVRPAPSAKEPTGEERKAATLLSRLEFSEKQLENVLRGKPGASKPGLVAEGLRRVVGNTAANVATPQARQQVEAAQLDILDAALTLGTGAAYTREQLEGYRRSYFPQIGDDSATVSDKQARLNNVIEAARISAGRAAPKTPRLPGAAPAAPASPAAPRQGAVQDGYVFMGGDPSQPSSWKKVSK